MASVSSSVVSSPQGANVEKKIFNETIASANVEQSLALPAEIVGYLIKVRGSSSTLKLTHVSGESGTKYLTIPRTGVHCDNHSYNNLTLYFQTPVAGVTVEIVTWEII